MENSDTLLLDKKGRAPMSHPTTEVVFTYEQGNRYLQMCHEEHPKDFGPDKKFTLDDLRTYDRNNRHFLKAVKKESPGFQARPRMISVFGDPKNWKERPKRTMRLPNAKGEIEEVIVPNQPFDPVYDLVEPLAEVTLHLNAYAQDALDEMMVVLTHPLSPKHLSPGDQQALVWDLADRIGRTAWLEGQIGLKPEKKEKPADTEPPKV